MAIGHREIFQEPREPQVQILVEQLKIGLDDVQAKDRKIVRVGRTDKT